jgi:hypothetical protein
MENFRKTPDKVSLGEKSDRVGKMQMRQFKIFRR